MATKKLQRAEPAQLRRLYVDCRFGQLHLSAAYPQSGGFDERTPLVLLHADGGTGADFSACAARLGTDRSVYAPDLPGCGASDGPPGRATIAQQAAGIADLLDQLQLREVDVLGCGRGVAVAFELAAARPQDLRRLIVAAQQQSVAATARPLLQLDGDPTRCDDDTAVALDRKSVV